VDSARDKSKNAKKRELWPVKVFFLTFVLALLFSFFAETTLFGVPIWAAILVLFFVILIGIVFDMVGVAVTVQSVTAYTAMASKKIWGAKQCIRLIQRSERVANICNDVIGDICGIVSGAMGAASALEVLAGAQAAEELPAGILISSLIAAMTVGGKAVGKRVATRKSYEIVWIVGRFQALFARKEKRKKD
jgi:CBS domain containing-hemolysin-like protein